MRESIAERRSRKLSDLVEIAFVTAAWFMLVVLAILAGSAKGQTTKPTQVAVWFQPVRNLDMLASYGVNVFTGPEVENSRSMTAEQLAAADRDWIAKTRALRAKVVLKRAPAALPDNTIGILCPTDEPNGKGVLPATIKAEADAIRTRYPGAVVWLSLAGDKITSANFAKPHERQLYVDYLAAVDVVTVNWYAKNRNANRYPVTYTGDAVAKLKGISPKPVWAWIEMNDQQLPPPPTPDVNRAPTPAEIRATVDDAVSRGAAGYGWFATCDSGKYGWPGSYWPTVDRSGASMQPQIDMVKTLGASYIPPPDQPTNADLMAKLNQFEAILNDIRARQDRPLTPR